MSYTTPELLLLLAATKLSEIEKEDRETLFPGLYSVKGNILVAGTVRIEEDHNVSQVNKCDPWRSLVYAMNKLSKADRVDVVENMKQNIGIIERSEEDSIKLLKKEMGDALKDIKSACTITRKGAVKIDGDLEVKTVVAKEITLEITQ